MTAAAFAGIVLAGGTRAIIAAVLSPPVILLYALFAAVVLYVSRRLRQHGRTAPLLPIPPEVGDDTIAMIREAREQDRAEAADDYLGGLLAEWERDWRKQRGDRND